MRLKTAILCLCAVGVTSVAHSSPIVITFASAVLTGAPGDVVTFSGTVEETGGITTFLNGDSLVSPFPADDTPFLTTFPLSLNGDSFTGPMFSMTIPLGTGPGLYSGTFDILGGPTPVDLDTLASQTFAVEVQAPEPATLTLLAGGVLSFLAYRRRGRRG